MKNIIPVNKIRLLLMTSIAILLSGCEFEQTPWQTDVHCPNLEIERNLAWLKSIEQQKSTTRNFKAAVIGDPQQYPQDLESVVKKINEQDDIDFILLLGDLTETGIKQEFEWTCKALSASEKPVLPVIGNHDALAYGKEIWQNIFGDFDYSFTYKNTKFVAYNDNQYEFKEVPDRVWLKEQAKLTNNEEHLVAVSHIQPWGRDAELSEYLKTLGFDQAIHAHDHRFNFFQSPSEGIPHFITADTTNVKYAVMTVTTNNISFEQCDPECLPAAVSIRELD